MKKNLELVISSEIQEILGAKSHISKEYDIPLYQSKNVKKYKKVLILSGGGVRGVAHLGALKAMETKGCLDKFEVYAGTSIGALILALYLIGYSPDEQFEFIKKFDLTKMKNINIANILQHFGLDNGERMEYVIKRLIQAKGFSVDLTLGELYDKTKKKLIVTTVCLNSGTINYMSYEQYPHLPLYLAVRMSTAIPLFYTPIKYNNRLYIDGGCVDNYPIKIFEKELDTVVGVYITETVDNVEEINNFELFITRIFKCFLVGMVFNGKKAYEKYTVDVNLEMISAVDFGIDDKKKEDMFKRGYNSVMNSNLFI